MSEPISYCPQCHNDVQFARSGDSARCPICGFEFNLRAGAEEVPPTVASTAISIGRVLLRIILIIIGVIVLGIAVLFAGCVLILGGHSIP